MRTDHADLLALYDRLGPLAHRYQATILRKLGPGLLVAAAERLGLYRARTFILDSESEMAVVSDLALYDVRINGLNAVQIYQQRYPPVAGSVDEMILGAMAQARSGIFELTRIVPGVGVECTDVARGGSVFVANRGLSHSGDIGCAMASRLLFFPALTMSTGADLFMSYDAGREVLAALRKLAAESDIDRQRVDDPAMWSRFWTVVIRACLRAGAAREVVYFPSRTFTEQGAEQVVRRYESSLVEGEPPPSRNRPCPCGSGMKYKHCCGPAKTVAR
jgi:hypothetical protein